MFAPFETQVIEVEVDALGHDAEVTYEWSDDYSTCTAYFVCHNDESHNATYTVNTTITLTKNATCTEDGYIIYSADFSEYGNYCVVGTGTEVILPALGHDYSVSYSWSDDYSKCTATATCSHGHSYSTINNSTYEVITPATAEASGVGRYTVTFKDPLFETQTQDVEIPYVYIPGMTPEYDEENNQISYGYYPQTRVTDTSLERQLFNNAELDSETGYYKWEGYYYAKVKPTIADSYVKWSDGTTINTSNYYFFRCDPIVWDVLKVENGRYTLLTDRVLNAHRYNEYYDGLMNGHYANNYKESELRQYLNDDFYNEAFGKADASYLLEETIDNSASTTDSSSNQYACENTQDKVYLLSYRDYLNADYGFATSVSGSATRTCSPTDYAKANKCFADTNDIVKYYWTRSPISYNPACAACVDNSGSLSSPSYYVGYYKTSFYIGNDLLTAEYRSHQVGIRPAITIQL